VNLPGNLNEALANWLAQHGKGGLAASTQKLSAAYRKGENSSHVNLAAYVATRIPATFESNKVVQQELAKAYPDFAPHSLLDVGAGPGVAGWAAVQAWPSIANVTQCEQDKQFAELAATLNAESEIHALKAAQIVLKSEQTLPPDLTSDLVTVSYMLAEVPLHTAQQVAARLWLRTKQVLVLIEPGTPQGFARLQKVREVLLGLGAFVLAPCTHQNSCPMVANDWCHFKTRVQRSREHMHAKGGTVPFEDEAFSYLVLSRQAQPQAQSAARVIAPVALSKHDITFRLCDTFGLRNEVIASRDKPTYKHAKKTAWGHVWE
jgi:ribosomal protein RSM22 (predicted rRNA methylase)